MADQTPDTSTQDTAKTQAKEFGTFLLEHNRGRTHVELTEKLAELVAAVEESGKGGKLQFTLQLKPSKTPGVVEVVDDVKVTAPITRARTSMFYIDPETSSLVRNDPNQRAFPDL